MAIHHERRWCKALGIAASGIEAQTTRLRVIAENLANQDTTGSKPGADPYRDIRPSMAGF